MFRRPAASRRLVFHTSLLVFPISGRHAPPRPAGGARGVPTPRGQLALHFVWCFTPVSQTSARASREPERVTRA